MSNNTKARSEQINTAAREAFGRLDLSPLDVSPDQYETVRKLAEIVMSETGCTLEAARNNINRILRARGNYERASWGGQRFGAGRKPTPPAPDSGHAVDEQRDSE